jgi:hypothetical protein
MRRYYYNLYVSDSKLKTLKGGTVNAYDCQLYLHDQGLLCFYAQEYDNASSSYVTYAIPESAALRFGIKPTDDRQGDFMVLSEGDAKWNVAGDWSDIDASSGQICVRVSCNVAALIAKYETATTYLDMVAEIQMLESGETEPTTLAQWPVRIVQDVIQGDEGDPESAVPAYITAAQVAAGYVAKGSEVYAVTSHSEGDLRTVDLATMTDDEKDRLLTTLITDLQTAGVIAS